MSTATLKMSSVGITGNYGPRMLNGRANFHKGMDFGFGKGVAVSSWGDGKVIVSGKDYEYGFYVRVQHAPGIVTSYHSLAKAGSPVGTAVRMGDTIGYAGSSALGATGPHLHAGLWLNQIQPLVDRDKHVNPRGPLVPGVAVTIDNNGKVVNPPPAPAPAPSYNRKRDIDMLLTWTTDGTGWYGNATGTIPLSSPQVYNLLFREINSNQLLSPFANDTRTFVPNGVVGRPEVFNNAERDIINAHKHLLAVAGRVDTPIDPAKMAHALADALGGKLVADVSEEVLANAYVEAFKRIAQAVQK